MFPPSPAYITDLTFNAEREVVEEVNAAEVKAAAEGPMKYHQVQRGSHRVQGAIEGEPISTALTHR